MDEVERMKAFIDLMQLTPFEFYKICDAARAWIENETTEDFGSVEKKIKSYLILHGWPSPPNFQQVEKEFLERIKSR